MGWSFASALGAGWANGGAGARRWAGCEEIMDDLDRTFDADETLRFRAQKCRDSRHAIGGFEGMADGRAVTGVAAEQGGVGAVECGDDFGAPMLGEHIAREERGGRVRHGVVRVDEIETVVTGNFGEFHGQRQCVIGIFEETVAVDLDGMKVDMGGVGGEAKRALVADEMNLVAAGSEFFSEGRGEDAAATDAGVAGDADFE